MQISKETLAILKNFASINGNIKVEVGSQLKTISVARNVLAEASVTENFPKEFCIYNLGEFLNCVTLFEEADLEFGDQMVTISANGTKLNYKYSSPSIIVSPEKPIKLEDAPDVKFTLTAEDLGKLNRGAGAVNGDTIKITCSGNEITLEALDDRTTVNTFKMKIAAENAGNGEFRVKRANMNFIAGNDYEVSIWQKGISCFQGTAIPVKYYVALEK